MESKRRISMAKINHIMKSRKELRCSKCGKVLPVGSEYLKATPFHARPIIRCVGCGLRPWETSQSEFVLTCGSISEDWRNDYECENVDDIISDLENLRDNTQESYDNLPDSLQYGPTGEELENRLDMLDDVINELRYLNSFDDYMSNAKDEYIMEHDLDEDAKLDDDILSDIEAEAKDAMSSDIDDALSGLEY
jgi:hypothetical protein